ncbi:polysaccharide lyase family 7 protein [Leucothrix sargassi]|nr:polysaccharide lyase family 7 protein [Leucothrix sargassi]
MLKKYLSLSILVAASTAVSANTPVPADKFDMSNWKITLPMDGDGNGKVDEIKLPDLMTYSHPDFFFLDENNHLVFQVHNKAITTKGSSNARSELRQELRGADHSIGTKDPGNYFSLASHPDADTFGAIGGKMEATLKVNHVSRRAKYSHKEPAHTVVVGQIHAAKNNDKIDEGKGWGNGNEPLKIFYKKFPNHESGSVFWNYERNLLKADPDRADINYPVWGYGWNIGNDPKEKGLKLGDEFSYTVNVYGDIMYLTFSAEGKETKEFQISLVNNVDANGKVDEKNFAQGYALDPFYFKAGAYGQCSAKDSDSMWSPACLGTGDFKEDMKTGDYNSVTFSKLVLSEGTAPNE